MAKKSSTLYIDDAGIRLLVTRGRHVKKWAETKLEPGLIAGMVAGDPAKLGECLREFLKTQKTKARRFSMGMSAVHCLTREIVLPSLPRNLLEEAVVREARRLLPLPVEQLHLTWQIISTEESKIRVFLLGVRRASIDSMLEALKVAGVKPTSLFIKPLALAGLVKENAILVDVQAGDFDICILSDGVPQPIRTLPFPSVTSSWQAKLPIIMDEIDRTIKFYVDNNPQKPLGEDLPMYVSGELMSRARVWQRMTERFGFRVVPLGSPLDRPEGFDPDTYLVNAAMAECDPGSVLHGDVPLTSMNALPVEFRAHTIKWSRVLALPAAGAVLGVVLPLTLLVTGSTDNIVSTRDQLNASSRVLEEKQAEKLTMRAELKGLEERVAEVSLSYDALTRVSDTLVARADTVNGDLALIMNELTSGLALTKVSEAKTTFTVSGKVPDEESVLSYARKLDLSGRFAKTVVTSISQDENGKMTFVLTLMR